MHPSDDVTGDLDLTESTDIDLATATDLDVSLDEESTDTLEAELLDDLDEIDDDMETDLSDLAVEELDEELEATGDIDVGQLNRNLEIEEPEEDWDDEDDDDDEDSKSPIQKIIAQVKDAFGKFGKKKLDDDEEDDDYEATKTEIDPDGISSADLKGKNKILAQIGEKIPALKGMLAKLNKKKSVDEEDDDPNSVTPISYDSDEEEKPKKKLKIIHIVIIIGGALVLFYDDIFPPEEVAKQVKLKPRKKSVKKKIPNPVKESPIIKKAPVEVKDRTAEQIKEVGTTKKDEIVSDKDIVVSTDTKPTKVGATKETAKVEEPKVENNNDDLDDLFDEKESDSKLETPGKKPEVTKSEKESEKPQVEEVDAFEDEDSSDSMDVSGTGQAEPGLELVDGQIDDQVIDGSVNQDITKSILEDLEVKIQADKKQEKILGAIKPSDPPTYEISGRALVYNCSGKHWACIDSISFKTCEKNYAWNSSQGRKVECYPVKLFSGEHNCETKQQININNIAETEFCNF